MTIPEIAQAVGTTIGFAVVAFYSHRTDKQTRATGNGWAPEVTRRLDRIEKKIDGHLQSHADNDVHKD